MVSKEFAMFHGVTDMSNAVIYFRSKVKPE